MAGYGQIYVEVKADSVNSGISTLDASVSGGIGSGEGGESGIYWILWEYTVSGDAVTGGYTGKHWFWGYSNNYLQTGWANFAPTLGNSERYTTDLDGFKNYLIDNPNLTSLTPILGEWPNEQKDEFADVYQIELGGCFAFGSGPN